MDYPVITKILDWQTAEIIEGRKPTSITLSPWDKKELQEWAAKVLTHPPESTPTKVYGMEIK